MAARPIFPNYCLLKPKVTKQKKETIQFSYLESKKLTNFFRFFSDFFFFFLKKKKKKKKEAVSKKEAGGDAKLDFF